MTKYYGCIHLPICSSREEKCRHYQTKADICTEFIQRVYELSEKDEKKLPLEFWIGQVLREMEQE